MNPWKKLFHKNSAPTDRLGAARGMMTQSMALEWDREAFAAKHIFNRLSETSEYGFYYFPYSHLFRYVKWGTFNELGFRTPYSLPEIRKKFPNAVIVAIFGGSTGFSILVPDEDAFSHQLEILLNGDGELGRAVGKDFKVVNLAHPGNVVLAELINYTLFCDRLRPDIVISHDGWNDFIYGQVSDPMLTADYRIAYADILEAWGRAIHETDGVAIDYDLSDARADDFRPVQPKNAPETVIGAYFDRVRQFQTLVEANGARFISGFQPWTASKQALTESESRLRAEAPLYYSALFDNMALLYEMTESRLDAEKPDYSLNLHRAFAQLDASETHFGSLCHLLAPGERRIAEHYHARIRDLLLEGD